MPAVSVKGDVKAAQLLLKRLTTEEKLEALNKLNKDGQTALHLASQLGHSSIVQLILDTAEEINALDSILIQEGKETPVALLLACQKGHADIVKIYMEKIRKLPNKYELILQENIDGDTTLHFAVKSGSVKVVEVLLEHSKDSGIHSHMLLYKNNSGYTPLVIACKQGHVDILNTILAKAEQLNIKQHLICLEYPAEEFSEGCLAATCTCLGFACIAGHTQIVKTLMNAAAGSGILEKLLCLGVRPLLLALTYKHEDIIKTIIQIAARCEYPFVIGETHDWLPLHTACEAGSLTVVDMILDAVRRLGTGISGKDFVCKRNQDQFSALHIACKIGNTEIAGKIIDFADHLKAGEALITQCTDQGMNCLHYACKSENEECVNLLLVKADKIGVCKTLITQTDGKGVTALSYAHTQKTDAIISLLLNKAKELDCTEHIVCQKDEKGLSVLHHACDGDDDTMLELMITKAIEVGEGREVILQQDNNNQTGLHYACNGGHKDTAKILLSKASEQDIGKILLFMTDENGQSALHCAAQKGFVPVVQLLLKYALDLGVRNARDFICMRDTNGWTSMDLASQKDLELVQKIIMDNATRVKTIPQLCIPKNTGTALHAACCGTSTTIVKRIINSKTLSVEELLLHEDEDGDTALSVACNRNKKLLLQKEDNASIDIIDVLLNYARQHNVAEEMLCKTNKLHQNALTLACIKEGNEKSARKLFKVAMELKLYSILDKSQIEHQPQFLVEQFDKLYDEVALQIDVQKKADISDMSKLFVAPEKNQSFNQLKVKSLLTKIGDSGKAELITHPFTQFALALYWRKYARYLFFSFFIFYILFLIFFTFVMNNNEFVNRNGTVIVINTHTHFDYSCIIVTMALAFLQIIFELWQLFKKRWYYIQNWQNYLDNFVYLSALSVCVLMLVEKEHSWSHLLGTIALFAGWVNAAHILTIVPTFGFRFVMLFNVLWNVILFLPVLAIFIFSFALVFHNLVMNNEQFGNMGRSIMKTMAMGIGELDFFYLFYNAKDPTPFTIVTYVMFAVSLAIMTVSVMNLLIGVAIGDIENVKRTSKVRAFVTLSDLVLEYNSLFPCLVGKLWKERIKKSDFVKLALNVKASEESQKDSRRAKETEIMVNKIQILFKSTKDMDLKLNLKYESLEKEVKYKLDQMEGKINKRFNTLELQLADANSKSENIKDILIKMKQRGY